MYSQSSRQLSRSIKTKENEAPSRYLNRPDPLNSSNVSNFSTKELKEAVLRNLTLDDIESLKEEAMRYRGKG
jgi:hypothetical protein